MYGMSVQMSCRAHWKDAYRHDFSIHQRRQCNGLVGQGLVAGKPNQIRLPDIARTMNAPATYPTQYR